MIRRRNCPCHLRRSSGLIASLLIATLVLTALSASRSASYLSPPIQVHAHARTDRVIKNDGHNTTFVCQSSLRFISPRDQGWPLQLASYPGSGNTWMRELIQRGTGLVTGSAYRDLSLHGQGFPGEKIRNGSVIIVKTHSPCAKCWSKRNGEPVGARDGLIKDAAGSLLILRNPFDTLVAEFNRKMTNGNHTGVVHNNAFQSNDWIDFVAFRSRSWTRHTHFYLSSFRGNQPLQRTWIDKFGRPVRVVFFELLRSDPEAELNIAFTMLRELAGIADCHVQLPSSKAATYCALYSTVSPTKHQSMRRIRQEKGSNGKYRHMVTPFSVQQVATLCGLAKPFWVPEVWGPCDGKLAWERALG